MDATTAAAQAPIRLIAVAIAAATVGAAAAGFFATPPLPGDTYANAPDLGPPIPPARGGVRTFDLDIVAVDLPMGNGAVWHAWTFGGTVPGPTLKVLAGETMRVTVRNTMDIVHSFHTHLVDYSLDQDGSQVNSITGIGMSAMIPPGGSYTYEFRPTRAGVNYYHCHSADGGHTISQHMAQGLYGAILVLDPQEPPIRDEVLFMAERGFDVDGQDAPYYIMNGKGMPGGEHALEAVAAEHGAQAVVDAFGVLVPAFTMRLGETMRLAVVNIGDQPHTFHQHAVDLVSVDQDPGQVVPANVVQLLPGGADRVLLTPTRGGVWLFHCHVVSHADQGMIGVLVVEDPDAAPVQLPGPTGAVRGGHAAMPEPTLVLDVAAGAAGQELRYTPPALDAPAGAVVEVMFRNMGQAPHTFTIPDLGADTGTVAPGGQKSLVFTVPDSGVFEYFCTVPGHQAAGMVGRLSAA